MIHLSGSHLLRQSKPRHCLLVISRDCKNTLWHSECAFEKSYKKVQYWHKIYWVLMPFIMVAKHAENCSSTFALFYNLFQKHIHYANGGLFFCNYVKWPDFDIYTILYFFNKMRKWIALILTHTMLYYYLTIIIILIFDYSDLVAKFKSIRITLYSGQIYSYLCSHSIIYFISHFFNLYDSEGQFGTYINFQKAY